MSKESKKGITVRFENHEMEQLEKLASRYKVTSAVVIRWALAALVEYVNRNNGKIALPLDFSQMPVSPPISYSEAIARKFPPERTLRLAEDSPEV